jgi:hypothetical protein
MMLAFARVERNSMQNTMPKASDSHAVRYDDSNRPITAGPDNTRDNQFSREKKINSRPIEVKVANVAGEFNVL